MKETRPLAFVDIETTGLDRDLHVPWEIAVFRREPDGELSAFRSLVRLTPRDEVRADHSALDIGMFWNRYSPEKALPRGVVALDVRAITHDAVLVGKNVDFDEEFLRRLLQSQNVDPMWHYRKTNVDDMARLITCTPAGERPPYADLGINVDGYRQHEALEDARLAMEIYDTCRRIAQRTNDSTGWAH